ncbi:ABC transporter substrate-binding protein [Halorarum salinum]|uniref:ABC transporter substrate-binding protein n=1 Tax=Halorarum salinum TaxID=2743089 RepID=A0A7D5QB02_9EURY|nr:ABC transporter substrate-binding protein [Halobaculum salinum]QLG61420.1 ABC transporter substrate-binding protein [Halobaculum salinum]
MTRLLGVAAAGTVAGCTGARERGEPSPDRPNGYVVGSASDAQTLNFVQIADGASSARVGLTMDGTYAITPDDELFPLWADVSTEDGRVYEVSLRETLRWSDPYGPMTAADWVYMIRNVFQSPDNWAGFVGRSDWVRDGSFVPVERTGTYSFEVRLPEPEPEFPMKPGLWGALCLPRGLLERYVPEKDVEGMRRDAEIQTLSYTGNLGPYRFERWERDARFVAVRNEDYYMHDVADVPDEWRTAPHFPRYVFQVVPEESARLSALQSGEVTETGVPETKVDRTAALPGVEVNVAPQPFCSLLVYNQRANGWTPLRRRTVREALSYAIDKTAVVRYILRGYANVAHTFQPAFSAWYDASRVRETGVGTGFDPREARDRLIAALGPDGYRYDDRGRLRAPDGRPVALRLVFPVGSETTQTVCEFIAQSYDEVGIEVTLRAVQFNTLLSQYVSNGAREGRGAWNAGPFNGGTREESTSPEQWDLQYGIVFNTYPRTPTATRDFWVRDGAVNFFGYEPAVDLGALYDEAATELNEDRRRGLFARIFGVLSDDQPCNFLHFSVAITGYLSGLEGPVERFGTGWNYQTWRFTTAANVHAPLPGRRDRR